MTLRTLLTSCEKVTQGEADGVDTPIHTLPENNGDPKPPLVGEGVLATMNRSAWPEWLRKHVRDLEMMGGSDRFKSVLEKFVKLEMLLGFPTGQVCVWLK